MAGQRQKAPGLLANRRGGRGRALTVVRTDRAAPPFPLRNTEGRKRARLVWRRFWASPVSAAVDLNADAEPLLRWMEAIDQREKLLPLANGAVLVKGSMGQLVLNPLFARIEKLERTIEWAEQHFGATPLSRFRLQLTVSEAGQSEERLRALRERRQRNQPKETERGMVVDGEARVVEL